MTAFLLTKMSITERYLLYCIGYLVYVCQIVSPTDSDLIQAVPLSDSNRQEILNLHNAIRRNVSATNMQLMTWSPYLEELASNWSRTCSFDHRPDIPIPYGESYIGENIWDTLTVAKPANFTRAVNGWYYDEVPCFNMTSLQCDVPCGDTECTHFLQVITYNVHEIGCGLAKCQHLTGEGPTTGPYYILVCNYIEYSNWYDEAYQRPYETSDATHPVCSGCPTDMPVCVSGLCAVQTSDTTSSAATSSGSHTSTSSAATSSGSHISTSSAATSSGSHTSTSSAVTPSGYRASTLEGTNGSMTRFVSFSKGMLFSVLLVASYICK